MMRDAVAVIAPAPAAGSLRPLTDRSSAKLDNLTVHILAVADLEDCDLPKLIVDEVHDAIVSLSNPEAIGIACEFLGPVCARVVR
jgi:hypothetical protein